MDYPEYSRDIIQTFEPDSLGGVENYPRNSVAPLFVREASLLPCHSCEKRQGCVDIDCALFAAYVQPGAGGYFVAGVGSG